MTTTASLIWFVALSTLTIVVWALSWRAVPARGRFPWIFYTFVYIITTGIGAAEIGLTDNQALVDINNDAGWGLDISFLPGSITPVYWILLFAPLVAPAMFFLAVPLAPSSDATIPLTASPGDWTSPAAFFVAYIPFAGYCVLNLILNGYGMSITMWFQSEGDFVGMMLHRMALAGSLGSVFFGISYITLPSLTQAALYEFVRTRRTSWTAMSALAIGLIVFIDLSLMQKSHVMLHLLIFAVGLAELKYLRWKSVGLVVAGLFGGLTFLMSLMLDQWDSSQTVRLVVYRMAHAYPYYLTIFPEFENNTGIDLGLHLIGIGVAPDESRRVFWYMYPGLHAVEGNCPAPAHITAFAQGGMVYGLLVCGAIGALIRWSAGLRTAIRGPLGFALYMQSLMTLYYVAQTSVRESLVSCYGIVYAFVGLAPLYFLCSGGARSVARETAGRKLQRHAS
jgi:hypothetical protein